MRIMSRSSHTRRPAVATRRPSGDSYERVYRVVRRIPRGRVATYGAVAAVAGLPGRARLVGYALFASGPHRGLPWHRVLGAGGRITLVKLDPDAALTQRLRLEAEGVRFDGHGRVDLEAHAWPAPARGRVTRSRRRARRRVL
jgi:methylated-DNA-protein-cysteine methyltransferase related protein